MRFLVIALCLGCVLANESLLDELDKILSDDIQPVRSAKVGQLHDMIDMLTRDNDKKTTEKYLDALENRLSAKSSLDLSDEKLGIEDKISSSDESLNELEKELLDEDSPKYGYCVDGVSKAEGPNKQGCARLACYDEVEWCKSRFSKEFKMRNAYFRTKAIRRKCLESPKAFMQYRENCPFTCSMCKPRSPKKTCEKKYGIRAKTFGCCAVGGTPALGPNKQGCVPCHNFYPHVCRQFMMQRFGVPCHTGAYRVRTFLFKYCPMACKICKKGEL